MDCERPYVFILLFTAKHLGQNVHKILLCLIKEVLAWLGKHSKEEATTEKQEKLKPAW